MSAKAVSDKDYESLLKRRAELGSVGKKTDLEDLEDRLSRLKDSSKGIKERDLSRLKKNINDAIAEQMLREAEETERNKKATIEERYKELKERERSKTVLGKIRKAIKSITSRSKKGGKRRTCKKRTCKRRKNKK